MHFPKDDMLDCLKGVLIDYCLMECAIMMIIINRKRVICVLLYVRQNIFESPAQVIVNAVNTVGVMGKGIAKQYKQLYPEMYKQYRYFCEQDMLEIGKLWLYQDKSKWILNFPTKKHWRSPSKIEYIELG